jgi:hypothetical protein
MKMVDHRGTTISSSLLTYYAFNLIKHDQITYLSKPLRSALNLLSMSEIISFR